VTAERARARALEKRAARAPSHGRTAEDRVSASRNAVSYNDAYVVPPCRTVFVRRGRPSSYRRRQETFSGPAGVLVFFGVVRTSPVTDESENLGTASIVTDFYLFSFSVISRRRPVHVYSVTPLGCHSVGVPSWHHLYFLDVIIVDPVE